MGESVRLFMAALLSVAVLLVWRAYFEHRYLPHLGPEWDDKVAVVLVDSRELNSSLEDLITKGTRVILENSRIKGSLNLVGATFDDLVLKGYKSDLELSENHDFDGNKVRIFSPEGTDGEYFGRFGWESKDGDVGTPDAKSLWVLDEKKLDGSGFKLSWDSGGGLVFKLDITIDDGYLFTVSQSVVNNTKKELVLCPRMHLQRVYDDFEQSYLILHQGPIGTSSGELFEVEYKDLVGSSRKSFRVLDRDWAGFSDKYWASLFIGQGNRGVGEVYIKHEKLGSRDLFFLDLKRAPVVVAIGTEVSINNYLFAGAKELNLIDKYFEDLGAPILDRVVDFGKLYFVTKPVFLLLQYFNSIAGNFGLAILLLTVVVKLAVFPLSYRSYSSMSKMRSLQPEIARIRSEHQHDKVKLQQKTMALFKKQGVSPTAGCLPTLLQVPVFFSLYKVLFITLEMRHAPFYFWIKDLSVNDPSSVFTLFGLLDIPMPDVLNIGVLPIMLGFTMFFQQKLNSLTSATNLDSEQAKVLKIMPYIFTFLFASFPTGLIIYWIWNNILSMTQQFVISRYLLRG